MLKYIAIGTGIVALLILITILGKHDYTETVGVSPLFLSDLVLFLMIPSGIIPFVYHYYWTHYNEKTVFPSTLFVLAIYCFVLTYFTVPSVKYDVLIDRENKSTGSINAIYKIQIGHFLKTRHRTVDNWRVPAFFCVMGVFLTSVGLIELKEIKKRILFDDSKNRQNPLSPTFKSHEVSLPAKVDIAPKPNPPQKPAPEKTIVVPEKTTPKPVPIEKEEPYDGKQQPNESIDEWINRLKDDHKLYITPQIDPTPEEERLKALDTLKKIPNSKTRVANMIRRLNSNNLNAANNDLFRVESESLYDTLLLEVPHIVELPKDAVLIDLFSLWAVAYPHQKNLATILIQKTEQLYSDNTST